MDQTKSAAGYCGPMTRPVPRTMHPEMCGDMPGDGPADPTVASLANVLEGQLADATDKVERMLGRLQGMSVGMGAATNGPPDVNGITPALVRSREKAATLHKLLDELESRIGG